MQKVIISILSFFITMVSWAPFAYAAPTSSGKISDYVTSIGKFINTKIMPIVVAAGVLWFFWNLIFYIRNMSNSTEREGFKKYTINSLIALFIMLSVWGILAIGTKTLFGKAPIVPQLPICDNTTGSSVPCQQ